MLYPLVNLEAPVGCHTVDNCAQSLCGTPDTKICFLTLPFVFPRSETSLLWNLLFEITLEYLENFTGFCLLCTEDQKETRFFSFDLPSDIRFIK